MNAPAFFDAPAPADSDTYLRLLASNILQDCIPGGSLYTDAQWRSVAQLLADVSEPEDERQALEVLAEMVRRNEGYDAFADWQRRGVCFGYAEEQRRLDTDFDDWFDAQRDYLPVEVMS